MVKLSAKERLKRAIEHKEVDRPPIFDKLRNNGIIEYYAGQPLGIDDRETVCKAAARCLDCIANIRGPAEPRSVTTPGGRRLEIQKWTAWEERAIKNEEQLEKYLRNVLSVPYNESNFKAGVAAHVEDYLRLQSWCGEDCVVALNAWGLGLHSLIQLGGLEVLSYFLAEGTGLEDEYLERCTREAIDRGKILASYNLTFFVHTGEDIAFKTSTMLSPDWLRQKFFPRMKRIVDFWHDAGYYVQFHSDGNMRGIIPDFVASGVDAMHPMEKLADMYIPDVVREFGTDMTYCGGVDVSQLLPFGSPEEVAAEVREIIASTGGTGLWIGSTTEVNNEVPLANYKALVDTVRLSAVRCS